MYRPSQLYPENWNRLRWAIFSKYNYRCQRCGKYSKGNLHLHHILPIGCGGSHENSNLIPLCAQCHHYIHRYKKRFR